MSNASEHHPHQQSCTGEAILCQRSARVKAKWSSRCRQLIKVFTRCVLNSEERGRLAQCRIVFAPIGLIQDLKGAFGARRPVAALEIVFWPGNGSLLPFSGETNAWLQAHRGIPGSKLPVRGSTRLLKAATSRRTPNAPGAPCVKSYAALGERPALLFFEGFW
jgi:hypothetical protein